MIKKINHLGVMVENIDKALDFYQNFLGFKVLKKVRTSNLYEVAFIFLEGQENCQIELVCGPDVVEKVGVVNHLAFEVENIEKTLGQAEQYGLILIDKEPKIKPMLGIKHAFFWGPNGEKLELIQKI